MEIVNVNVDELKFAEYNPREITEHDFEALKNAIKEFGIVDPIIVNKPTNEIVGGHMRVRAAKELGIIEVPVYYVDLPDEKVKVLNLALNRIQGRWSREKLETMLFELSQKEIDMTLSGFENWELEFYNPGPPKAEDASKDIGDFQGITPNEATQVILIFTDKEFEEFCAITGLGADRKTMYGREIIDMLKGESGQVKEE